MSKRKTGPQNSAPQNAIPLYSTFPTATDAPDPVTGVVKPPEERVESVRNWGQESKQ